MFCCYMFAASWNWPGGRPHPFLQYYFLTERPADPQRTCEVVFLAASHPTDVATIGAPVRVSVFTACAIVFPDPNRHFRFR